MPNNHGLTLSLKKSNPLETDCENLYVLIGAYPDAILIFHGVVAKPVEAPDQERGFVYSGGQWYELLAWFGLQYPPEVPVKLIPDRENWAVKPDPVQLRLTRPDITDKPEPSFESIPRLKTLRLRWGEGFALGSNFFCTVRRVRCEDEGQLTPGSSTLVDGTVEVLFQTTREDDEPTIFHGEKYFPRVEKFYEVW